VGGGGIRGRFSNGLSLLGGSPGDKVRRWRGVTVEVVAFGDNKLDVTRTHLHRVMRARARV